MCDLSCDEDGRKEDSQASLERRGRIAFLRNNQREPQLDTLIPHRTKYQARDYAWSIRTENNTRNKLQMKRESASEAKLSLPCKTGARLEMFRSPKGVSS